MLRGCAGWETGVTIFKVFLMTDPLSYKHVYRRNLSHVQPPGATLFVTFRLAGSLPAEVLERWREEAKVREKLLASLPEGERDERRYLEGRRFFGRYDAELDGASYGPTWLRRPDVAAAVAGRLHVKAGLAASWEEWPWSYWRGA